MLFTGISADGQVPRKVSIEENDTQDNHTAGVCDRGPCNVRQKRLVGSDRAPLELANGPGHHPCGREPKNAGVIEGKKK